MSPYERSVIDMKLWRLVLFQDKLRCENDADQKKKKLAEEKIPFERGQKN